MKYSNCIHLTSRCTKSIFAQDVCSWFRTADQRIRKFYYKSSIIRIFNCTSQLIMADASSATVNLIRSNLREHRKVERLNDRDESSDALRVGVGAIKEIISDFDNITEKDVTGLASRIKRKKGATGEDLNRLSHAFLLNVENITTFAKITGALNVIVKELTGNDSTRCILACECLCNFSLGNEVCCEKLTLAAGSYLILFLENTNQRLAITSAWTISNILVSDRTKAVDALLSQGLIPKLVSLLKLKSSNKELVAEILKCFYLILSKHQNCLRSEDKMIFPPIVADLFSVDGHYGIKVTYHALFMCDFELTQEDYKKVFGKCAEFLCNFIKNCSSINSPDEKLCVALVLRIVGNFIALQTDNALNEFMGQLALQNETVTKVFRKILEIDLAYKNEIFWIAGNIYQVNPSYKDEIVSALMV